MQPTDDRTPAVGAPVERPVRPCAWTARSWLANRGGGHFVPARRQAFDVPLYDQAALEAAVAAERARWETAARLAIEATPEQLPMALDALADVLLA